MGPKYSRLINLSCSGSPTSQMSIWIIGSDYQKKPLNYWIEKVGLPGFNLNDHLLVSFLTDEMCPFIVRFLPQGPS